ncbi:MAG: chemotaxis protein CheR [Spirochaetaceae bacterium]|jgi:chemotaxis protein methyltransferase CheR|nr:chemotaxis protein CheR [Spirochaetaceae bacterium]
MNNEVSAHQASDTSSLSDSVREAPPALPGDPVIANLSRRVEQTLGIRAAVDALEKLREYLEQQYGSNCFNSPYFYEQILSFPEDIFTAARFLTINETYFFREAASFDLFRQELLPSLVRLNRPVRVCSAATSIGCEAYSLAMVMEDYRRTVQPFAFGIDAFDVDGEAIAAAKKGRYTGNALREDGSRWKFLLDRYTQAEGQDLVMDPVLRKHIRFYTHNLLDGLWGNRYDLIFFRNALIYFSEDKRQIILDHLVDALFDGAFLVLGVSETPAVVHPLLESRNALNTFYFRKIPEGTSAASSPKSLTDAPPGHPPVKPVPREAGVRLRNPAPAIMDPAEPSPEPSREPRKKIVISPAEPEGIAALIDDHEGGHPIAAKLPELLNFLKPRIVTEGENPPEGDSVPPGDELFAAVIYLLGLGDFSGADRLLSFIEKHHNSAFTLFLRGEYHYFNHRKKEAEASYQEAAGKNTAFWPAFYRLCVLAAEGNPVQYEYKIRKALESIKQGREKHYEIFIGGFSPDYYQRILEKKLN